MGAGLLRSQVDAFYAPRYYGAIHTKIDLSWIDLRSISVRFEKVFTLIWIDLSSHLSVHVQIALDLDRCQIDLTY